MAADPPEDPFDGVEDLIETSPPPRAVENEVERTYVRPWGQSSIVFETNAVERERLLHELRRSLAATHPLEGEAILARIEATLMQRESGAAAPRPATCAHCGCALRVVDRPRSRPVDPAERAGLLASASKSFEQTRADAAALEALARELARVDIVLTRGGNAPCPLCQYLLVWPADG